MRRFVLEGNKIIHSSQTEGNPYLDIPEFFGLECENRVDKEYEPKKGGDGRYYVHSKLINDQVRILVLYSPHRIGKKDILSETLEDHCLELCANNTKNLNWWFKLEESLFNK
jgi:hypothetical protein